MKIVIDTNRIMASLLKDGMSRVLIFSRLFQFITPDYALLEIDKYREYLCKKAHLTSDQFQILINLICEKINIIPQEEYRSYIFESQKLILDKDDAPFLALALSLQVDGIWSDDKDFKSQTAMKVFTTKDMLELLSI